MYIFGDISSIAHNSPNFEFKSRARKSFRYTTSRESCPIYHVVFRRAKQEQDKQARAEENLT